MRRGSIPRGFLIAFGLFILLVVVIVLADDDDSNNSVGPMLRGIGHILRAL